MSAIAERLVEDIDALPEWERDQVLREVLRRKPAGGDVPDDALVELADDIFQMYDNEEQDDAVPAV